VVLQPTFIVHHFGDTVTYRSKNRQNCQFVYTHPSLINRPARGVTDGQTDAHLCSGYTSACIAMLAVVVNAFFLGVWNAVGFLTDDSCVYGRRVLSRWRLSKDILTSDLCSRPGARAIDAATKTCRFNDVISPRSKYRPRAHTRWRHESTTINVHQRASGANIDEVCGFNNADPQRFSLEDPCRCGFFVPLHFCKSTVQCRMLVFFASSSIIIVVIALSLLNSYAVCYVSDFGWSVVKLSR